MSFNYGRTEDVGGGSGSHEDVSVSESGSVSSPTTPPPKRHRPPLKRHRTLPQPEIPATRMAAGVVRCAIAAVMEKTPPVSPYSKRGCTKLRSQEFLDKIMLGDAQCDAFDKFSTEIIRCIKEMITVVSKQYKLNSSKRAKLWTEFHKMRQDQLSTPALQWKNLLKCLDTEIADPLLYQSLLSELFKMLLTEHFEELQSQQQGTTSRNTTVELSIDDLNSMRYACGYVTRTILKKYESRSGDVSAQVQCLGNMAVEGEGDNVQEYTKKWFELVNRGGLFPLNDETFQFFVQVEKRVKILLPKHAITLSDKETFKESVVDKVIQDEDVDFTWTLISQDIDNPEDSEALLTDIVKLWVTVRGFSLAASWMEEYKKQAKKTTQKSTGLRKSISGPSNS